MAVKSSKWLNLRNGSGWLRFRGSPLNEQSSLGQFLCQAGTPTCQDDTRGYTHMNTTFCQVCIDSHYKSSSSPCKPCRQQVGPFETYFGTVGFAALAVGIVLPGLAHAIYRKCLCHLPVSAELGDHVMAAVGCRVLFFSEKAVILVFFQQQLSTLVSRLPASWTAHHVADATSVPSLPWMSGPPISQCMLHASYHQRRIIMLLQVLVLCMPLPVAMRGGSARLELFSDVVNLSFLPAATMSIDMSVCNDDIINTDLLPVGNANKRSWPRGLRRVTN